MLACTALTMLQGRGRQPASVYGRTERFTGLGLPSPWVLWLQNPPHLTECLQPELVGWGIWMFFLTGSRFLDEDTKGREAPEGHAEDVS